MMNNKKVVIIGGGVAGLSAGIYGEMNGYETEIIEMHSKPGGQCTAWDRKGYRFDYCLHWLVGTSSGPFNDIWKETNVINSDIQIIDNEIHSKVFNAQKEEFILYTNIEQWENYLKDYAPEDKLSIERMCGDLRKSVNLIPFSNPPGFRKINDYLSAFRQMLPLIVLFFKYKNVRCSDYFRKLNFKNKRLANFFDSLYAEQDFPALVFLMMFAWFSQKNAGYLIGGSLPIAERMAQRYKELGGKLRTGKRVKEIIVETDIARGVRLNDGTEVNGDYVISAADGHSTLYDMLGGKYLSKELRNAYKNWNLFPSFVQVSFGIKDVIKTDSTSSLYLCKGKRIGSTVLKAGYGIMNYEFDKTMSASGKTSIVLRFDSPFELWKDMDEESYKKEKEDIITDCITIIEELFPGVTRNIEVIDVATPRTTVKYTGVWQGAYEGFMPTRENFGKNLKMTLPGLKNFYMVGQWLFPGGGLPPAAQSGKWVFYYICKKDNKTFKTIES